MLTRIITHRGLDPSRPSYFLESSREAFADQLGRGYGLEFDLQLTRDGDIVISHDSNLKRISGGKMMTEFQDLSMSEITALEFDSCHLTSLDNLLDLMGARISGALCALHLKYKSQTPALLEALVTKLKGRNHESFIIFDVKPETAHFLKSRDQALRLAPSVAHPYDIKRYNDIVGGTLLSIEEALVRRDLYDWVWLDEWDRADEGGKTKSLYNQETFDRLHAAGFKIGLVTPELHGTSPGLLGGEAHPDAADHAALRKRIVEILKLQPDLGCTDFPDECRQLVQELNK